MSGSTANPITNRRNGHSSNRDNKIRRIDPKWTSPLRVSHPRLPWVPRRRATIVSPPARDEQELSFKTEVRRRTAWRQFLNAFSLERSFTVLGFVVAVLLISVFGLDLACGWPFRHASSLFDASSVICGATLAYLSWDVFWEQVRGLTR